MPRRTSRDTAMGCLARASLLAMVISASSPPAPHPDAVQPALSAPADLVLVLRCLERGKTATKTHTPDGTVPYHAGTWFEATARPVTGLAELSALLTELEADPRSLVVRGLLRDGASTAARIRRRYRQNDKDPRPPDLCPADHWWCCIDLDSAPSPPWLIPADPESLCRAVEWAIETYLPAEFRSAASHYQWSSSAGIKPWSVLRLHLWYWLSRPCCDPSLKAWLKPWRYIDGALYQPVQPHYTAAPRFLGGADPLAGRRHGLRPGRPDVLLPAAVLDLATWTAHKVEAEAQRRAAVAERVHRVESGELRPMPAGDATAYGAVALTLACAEVRDAGTPRNACHLAAARRLFGLAQAGLLDTAEVWERLAEAMRENLANEPVARRRAIPGILRWAQAHAEPFDLSTLATEPTITLAEAEARLPVLLAEAITSAAKQSGVCAVVVALLGLGKTYTALIALAAARGRGTFLAASHADLDRRVEEAEAVGLTRWRRLYGLTTALGPDGEPACRNPGAVEAAGRRGYPPRKAVCRVCPDCASYQGTGKPCPAYKPPKSRKRLTLFAVQSHAPYLGKIIKPPVIVDELPALLLTRTLSPGEMEQITAEQAWKPMADWCAPLAPLARLLVRAMRILAERPRKSPRYAERVSGAELVDLLRLAAAGGVQRTLTGELAVEGRRELAAALRSLPGVREDLPPYPRGRLRSESWGSALRGDLDLLLNAVLEEVHAADPGLLGWRERPRTAWVCLAAQGQAVRLEVRTRLLDGWKDKSKAPLSIVLLDATGARTEAAARGAMPNQEVRVFTMPRVAEATRAVSRLFIRTGGLVRRTLLTPDGALSARGVQALVRVLRDLGRRLGRLGEAPSLGIITHKPAEDLLRSCFSALDGDTEAAEAVAMGSAAAVMAELVRWREARRVGAVELGHFGAVRGRNEFKQLDALALLGAPWPDLGAVGEDARALGLDPQKYAEDLAEAETEQALGRAREVRRTGEAPVLLLHYGSNPPACWTGRPYAVDVLPAGGPTASEAAMDATDLALDVVEVLGACCTPLLRILCQKPELFQRLHGADTTAIRSLSINSSYIRSIAALSERELRRAVESALSPLLLVRTCNPTRRGKAAGWWLMYEARPGAADIVATALRDVLADDPDRLPDWAEVEL